MTLAFIITQLIRAYSLVILVYCVLSWFPIRREGVVGDIQRFCALLTEPYLGLFRRFIPPIGGTIDISPIIALVVLQFAGNILIRLLYFGL